MNADIKTEGRTAVVTGPAQLTGAEVAATDLRAGAALVLAGLVAEGETSVTELRHLDRGYVDFHQKLQALGANVTRVSVEESKVEEAEETTVLRSVQNR